MKEHPELAQRFKERRHRLDEHLKERRPEVYYLVVSLRELEKRIKKMSAISSRC